MKKITGILAVLLLLICSVADTDEDYEKLAKAVRDIDSSWQNGERSFVYAQDDTGHNNAQDDIKGLGCVLMSNKCPPE